MDGENNAGHGCSASYSAQRSCRLDCPTKEEIAHIVERLKHMEEQLGELHNIWVQTQGGMKLVQYVVWIAGPLIGAIWWIKNHIKW